MASASSSSRRSSRSSTLTSGRGTYANAGHPHAILATGASLERLGPTGPIVGPFVTTWQTGSMVVAPGGKLIIYTDGLVEARDPDRAFYGETRLVDLLLGLDCPRGAASRRPHPLATSTTSTRAGSPTTSPSSSPAAPGRDVTEAAPNLAEHVSEPSVSMGTAAPTAGSPALTRGSTTMSTHNNPCHDG